MSAERNALKYLITAGFFFFHLCLNHVSYHPAVIILVLSTNGYLKLDIRAVNLWDSPFWIQNRFLGSEFDFFSDPFKSK